MEASRFAPRIALTTQIQPQLLPEQRKERHTEKPFLLLSGYRAGLRQDFFSVPFPELQSLI